MLSWFSANLQYKLCIYSRLPFFLWVLSCDCHNGISIKLWEFSMFVAVYVGKLQGTRWYRLKSVVGLPVGFILCLERWWVNQKLTSLITQMVGCHMDLRTGNRSLQGADVLLFFFPFASGWLTNTHTRARTQSCALWPSQKTEGKYYTTKLLYGIFLH